MVRFKVGILAPLANSEGDTVTELNERRSLCDYDELDRSGEKFTVALEQNS